jgi:N6-L-threonylcarbamoyladenine synthase
MLGLELNPNGGSALEALAREGDPLAYRFTMPLATKQTCNFSYSGLKTAVRLAMEAALEEDGSGSSSRQVSPYTCFVCASVDV